MRSLTEYAGQWVLLYFYPQDDTPGCTTEACGFRDAFTQYGQERIAVLGVSADGRESHSAFAKKFHLPFPLLVDTEKTLIHAYGVWGEKNVFGNTVMGIRRMSFLINPSGVIEKVYERVKPEEHAEEVLRDVAALR